MVVELAGNHFVGGPGNKRSLLGRKFAEVLIDQCTGFFEDAERANEFAGFGVVPNVEMKKGTCGLRAIVAVGGNLNGSHGVGLAAGLHKHKQQRKIRALS